jgi:tripartite-type tricarboxylate transporter receptor subunit TctC
VTARLNTVVVAALNRPDVRDAIIRQGVEPRPSTPAEFGAQIAAEFDVYKKVVAAQKLSLD